MLVPVTNATLESRVERFLVDRVRLLGGMTFKIASTTKGLPDRCVVLPGGRVYLVELKAATGRLSPMQKHLHERFRILGTPAVVLAGKQEVVEWLRERVRENDPVGTPFTLCLAKMSHSRFCGLSRGHTEKHSSSRHARELVLSMDE